MPIILTDLTELAEELDIDVDEAFQKVMEEVETEEPNER